MTNSGVDVRLGGRAVLTRVETANDEPRADRLIVCLGAVLLALVAVGMILVLSHLTVGGWLA